VDGRTGRIPRCNNATEVASTKSGGRVIVKLETIAKASTQDLRVSIFVNLDIPIRITVHEGDIFCEDSCRLYVPGNQEQQRQKYHRQPTDPPSHGSFPPCANAFVISPDSRSRN
jgi:hypothetical protein